MTEIPRDLIMAYETTDFGVLEPREFTLRVGQRSADLQSLYVDMSVTCAGYLTAWNPFSKEASELENENAQQQLLRQLSLEGFPALSALGIDPSGDRLGEESVFVPGLSLDRAKLLGSKFGQNALCGSDPMLCRNSSC